MVIIFFFVTIAVCLIFWKALKSHKESLDKVAQAMDKIANALENVMAKIDETSSNVKILERRIYKIEAQINEPFTEEEQENESNQSV